MLYTRAMAIIKRTLQDEGKIVLEIDNGDLEALRQIEKDWKFTDESSVLRFALAVLTKAQDKAVYVDENGKKVALSPADSLLKQKE